MPVALVKFKMRMVARLYLIFKQMKKRLFYLIFLLVFCSMTATAATKYLYLSVGEEEKISLPSDFSDKGQWSNSDPTAIDIVRESSYSITIKVLKWVYHTCLLEYKEYSGGLKTYSVFISINKPVVTLSANPSGGVVNKGTIVYLTCSKNDANIYYSLNGSTPRTKYYSSGIEINETCTLKAFASWGGVDSDVITEKYTVDGLTLSASPAGGKVKKGTKVYLTASDPYANIYYTLDGSTPSKSSTAYNSSGITINDNCTLKAIAYNSSKTSDVITEYYYITKEIPINATYFPDENFRKYLLEQDYGKDGVITEEEFANITYMSPLREPLLFKCK